MRLAAIFVLAIYAQSAQAESISVCLSDNGLLGRHARAAFDREFSTVMPGVSLACLPNAIRLSVRVAPPKRYYSAMGLAFTNNDRVLPSLEVYIEPVVRQLFGSRSPAILGRALARVAAHEVAHYLEQTHSHEKQGLRRESFPAWELASDNSAPFLAAHR